jgi:hypothetical protein
MHTWKRLKCWLWHRRDRFNRHLLTLDNPSPHWKHTPHTTYSCNARGCGEIWIEPLTSPGWSLGPVPRARPMPASTRPKAPATWRDRFDALSSLRS